MAAKRCPKCNVFMNKTATVCLKCGWKETTETTKPVNNNMENKVVSQHATNNPGKSVSVSNPSIQPMNRTREQSNNTATNPEKNIPKNPHDYPTCEDGSYDFEKFTKYQMELLFDKYDFELPDFDYSKEDLVDLFVSLTESEDDEYEDSEYDEASEDDEYEDSYEYTEDDEEDVEEYEKMNMDDEDDEDAFDNEEPEYNDEENEDVEEDDEIDYSSLSLSELQNLCDERGITYSERDKKSKLIMYLVQADESVEEQEEEPDEEIDYSELSIPELKQLCDQYELKYAQKASKNSLIAMLCAYEEELEEDTDNEEPEYDEEDSEYDDEDELDEEYDEDVDNFDFIDFSAYTIAELKEMCDERNIKYKAKEKKQNLVMKLEEYEGYYDDLEDEEEQTTTSSASNITKLLGKVKKQPSETKEEQEEDDTVGNSSYQPNYDHYYDDVLPEVVAEMERIPKDAILKAIGGVILVFAAIVFFIYYF